MLAHKELQLHELSGFGGERRRLDPEVMGEHGGRDQKRRENESAQLGAGTAATPGSSAAGPTASGRSSGRGVNGASREMTAAPILAGT